MNKSRPFAVALCCAVWFASPAFAERPGVSTTPAWENENGAMLYVLEGAAARARERARMNKGSRRSWCLMKNVELDDLIERVERGQQVTLKEVDDAVDGLLRSEEDYQPVTFAGCD